MSDMNEQEAYNAMFAFLETYYERTGSDDVGALLGSLSLLPDGSPADAALWDDWMAAVRSAKDRNVASDMRLKRMS